jgi:hypothetical protein
MPNISKWIFIKGNRDHRRNYFSTRNTFPQIMNLWYRKKSIEWSNKDTNLWTTIDFIRLLKISNDIKYYTFNMLFCNALINFFLFFMLFKIYQIFNEVTPKLLQFSQQSKKMTNIWKYISKCIIRFATNIWKELLHFFSSFKK